MAVGLGQKLLLLLVAVSLRIVICFLFAFALHTCKRLAMLLQRMLRSLLRFHLFLSAINKSIEILSLAPKLVSNVTQI